MPDAMIPQVGDIIKMNGYPIQGMRVTRVIEEPGAVLSVQAIPLPPCPQTKNHTNYFNRFVIDGDRIRSKAPWPPGCSGYSSNGGGRNGDGHDEITIIARAEQPSLF